MIGRRLGVWFVRPSIKTISTCWPAQPVDCISCGVAWVHESVVCGSESVAASVPGAWLENTEKWQNEGQAPDILLSTVYYRVLRMLTPHSPTVSSSPGGPRWTILPARVIRSGPAAKTSQTTQIRRPRYLGVAAYRSDERRDRWCPAWRPGNYSLQPSPRGFPRFPVRPVCAADLLRQPPGSLRSRETGVTDTVRRPEGIRLLALHRADWYESAKDRDSRKSGITDQQS